MDEILITLSSSNQQFHSLSDVQEHIATNDIVTLLSDVTVVEPIVINKKCTIDLGGHFMFVSTPSAITVKGGVEVDFINGKIQTLSADQIEDSIIVQGSKTTVTFGETIEISTRGTAVHVRKRGTAVVDGALVTSTGSQPTMYVEDENSTLRIMSGSIESYEKSAVVARSRASLIIDGGEIHTECSGLVPETTYPSVLCNGRGSKVLMNDGSVFSSKTAAVLLEDSSEFEMQGGEVYSQSKDYIPIEVHSANTTFKMYGGFLYSPHTSAILSSGMEFDQSHTIQMLGGKMGGCGSLVTVAGPGDHNILFSDGVVKGILPQEYIATGYVVSDVKDDEGYAKIILKTWVDTPVTSTTSSLVSSDDLDSTLFDFEDLTSESNQVSYDVPTTPVFVDPVDVLPDVNHVPEHFTEIPPNYSGQIHCEFPHVPKQDIVYNSSVNIKHKIYIYNSPSRKHIITEWKGALGVLSGGYFSYSGEEFAMVKFKVPGSGRSATGYVPVYDISHP